MWRFVVSYVINLNKHNLFTNILKLVKRFIQFHKTSENCMNGYGFKLWTPYY